MIFKNKSILMFLAVGWGLSLVVLPITASAQGFTVQPMVMQVTPRPGHSISVPLQINNTSPTDSLDIDVRLVGLTQTPQASWWIVENEDEANTPHQASLLGWTELEANQLSIPRASTVETEVTIDVPRSAHGTYFGALLVETPRPEGAVGMVVRTRFLIPVIAQIKGRPARQNVAFEDIKMIYDDNPEQGEATTYIELAVANKGRTYSRIFSQVVVERLSEDSGQWYPVSRFEMEEKNIIPGVSVELNRNLERRLPSGEYRLNAQLNVDGRRVRPIDKVITFSGDPSVDALSFDTRLLLESELVSMDIVPGATRTSSFAIENPGNEPVEVSVAAELPDDLRGVALGELRGDRYSAVPWLEVQPQEFVIRPKASRNLRVISRFDDDAAGMANYYANISFKPRKLDGQGLDEVASMLHLTNRGIETNAEGAIDRLLILEGTTDGEYVVQARFVNTGNVHLELNSGLELVDGRSVVKSERLSSVNDTVLPLGTREISGELDFSDIDPGVYLVRVTAAYGFEQSTSEVMAIEVSNDKEDGQGVEIVILDEESGEIELALDDEPASSSDGG